VNTRRTSLDAFYLEHHQCGDLDGGVRPTAFRAVG